VRLAQPLEEAIEYRRRVALRPQRRQLLLRVGRGDVAPLALHAPLARVSALEPRRLRAGGGGTSRPCPGKWRRSSATSSPKCRVDVAAAHSASTANARGRSGPRAAGNESNSSLVAHTAARAQAQAAARRVACSASTGIVGVVSRDPRMGERGGRVG
jgi:hypothetical protein